MNGYKRFEAVATAYLEATDEQREAALLLIPETDRKTFLEGVGLFHLLTDDAFFRAAMEAMGQTCYLEFIDRLEEQRQKYVDEALKNLLRNWKNPNNEKKE